MFPFSKPDFYAPTCGVEIEGERLPLAAILSVSVDESLEAPSKFDISLNEALDITTQKFTWLDNPLINPGNEVEIFFGYAGGKDQSIFKGRIKALSPSFQSSGIPGLTVEGYDPSHNMQKKISKIKKVVDVTYSDIAREMATKVYNLKPDGIEDLQVKPKEKVERQKGENDYTFLRRLADEIGFEFFVREKTLYFRKPQDNKEIVQIFQYQKNLISFTPRLSTAALTNEVIVSGGVDEKTQKPIKEKVKLADLGAGSDMKSLKKFVTASEGPEPTIIEDKVLTSKREAMAVAKLVLKRAVNTFIQGTLECIGDPKLKSGVAIKIEGFGKLFSGNYYVKSARHTYNESGYKTTLEVRRIII